MQPVEDVEQVDAMHDAEAMDVIKDVEQPTRVESKSNPDQDLVRRVEMEIGRTHNAWGMVDPVELIDAVKRVIQGGAK